MSAYFEQMAQIWRERAPELAAWTMQHLVNRTDVWGRYLPKKKWKVDFAGGRGPKRLNHAITAPFREERGKVFLNEESLVKHYRARSSGGILGVHASDASRTSRWLAIDIDLHEEDNLSVTPEGNLVAAEYWHNRLRGWGFDPLLLDSNGAGGFHLLVLFAEPMATASVYEFGQKLISDYTMRGLDTSPETFPKQPRYGHYGNWLRLPGRHHSRQHFTRVRNDEPWADEPWLSGHDAIDRLLATRPAPAELLERVGIERRRRTVCLDFDGVLHSYNSPFTAVDDIPDPPIHGAREAVSLLRKQFRVVVYSSRCRTAEGRTAITNWLAKHRIEVDEVCEHKPPAMAYVDDRAVPFTGNWHDTVRAINDFRK